MEYESKKIEENPENFILFPTEKLSKRRMALKNVESRALARDFLIS